MSRRYGVQIKIIVETEWFAETPEEAVGFADEWLHDTYGDINYKANYFARELSSYDEKQ